MRMKVLFLAMLAALLSFGTFGCASNQRAQIPKAEMPLGASFSGLWYTNFGDMSLTQRADGSTRGNFDFKGLKNEIEGTVEGGVFIFDWMQPGDFQVGRREVKGKGYLVIAPDGLSMKGQWGYGENYTGGGEWTGNKATEIYR